MWQRVSFLGFTLTMWDVKVVQEKNTKVNDERFTLTMWDVKFTSESLNYTLETVLP